MALKAYTLDLALQTSSEFAIGHTIPNVEGIATDGKGFIPVKNSTNKTITLSKGFGKFGGRLFEMTEQTVYSWDAGSTDADAYLVIDLTKQNSFTGTIEDGTYTFVDNQSSIVISSTQPEPSANTLVYKLDGNYQTENYRSFSDLAVSGTATISDIKTPSVKTGSTKLGGLTINFRQTVVGVNVYMEGHFDGSFSTNDAYVSSSAVVPAAIDNPRQNVILTIVSNGGVGGVTTNSPWRLEVLIDTDGKIKYRAKNLRDNDTGTRGARVIGADSTFYALY